MLIGVTYYSKLNNTTSFYKEGNVYQKKVIYVI